MRQIGLLVSLLLGLSPVLYAQAGSVVLSAVSGTVEFQAAPEQPWKSATVGAEIDEGSSVRTGPDGRAQITFPDKAVIWIRESSNFGMQSTLPLARKVQVNQGEVKLSVPHLKRKQTFEVHAGNAVAAVRGTTFTVKSIGDGTLDVKCAYGQVMLHLLTDAKTYSVTQGTFFSRDGNGAGKVTLMNHEQENDVLQNWAPGLTDAQRINRLNQTAQSRVEIHNFAQQTIQQQQAVESLVGEIKQNDFSAGRSLVDAHGNLTRVEQYLIRPNQDDVEFVNLVSRPVYKDPNEAELAQAVGGSPLFYYSGPQGGVVNRLDSLTAYVQFQTYNNNVSGVATLPQNLSDWPSYFSNNSVRPDITNVVLTNQTDPGNILITGYFGQWCGNVTSGSGPCSDPTNNGQQANSFGQDTIATDLYLGNASNITALGQMITSKDPTAIANAAMTKFYHDDNVTSYSINGQANGQLISQNATAYCAGGSPDCTGATQYVWMGTEEYVINNGGQVQNVSYFTNSNTNPFSLVTSVAGEVVVFDKLPGVGNAGNAAIVPTNGSDGNSPNISNADFVSGINPANNNFNNGGNIDLVLIPDLGLSILENMASSLGHLSTSSSNNNNSGS